MTISAISLLLVLGFAGFGLYTRRTAQQEAALAQRFGQEITNIEGMMRTAYLWPLHDVSGQKNMVRERMKSLEKEMSEFGAAGIGPGHYALGRGHLALDEYEPARVNLQRAWDAGFRQPQVAYALGLALGRLYQKELEDVKGTRDKKMRAAKTRELENTYRDPALRYLQAGKSEATEYVEALIAFYERRWADALQKTAEARKRHFGLYEIQLLEGDIYRAIAVEYAANGQNKDSAENFNKAADRYKEVVQIARSDPSGYKGLCTVTYDYEYMKANAEGGDLAPGLTKSIGICEQGLKADSRNTDLSIQQARAYRMLADSLMGRGEDGSNVLARGETRAMIAIETSPTDGRAHAALGAVLWSRAGQESARGQDPTQSLNKAIESYQTATKLRSGYEYAYLAIGGCYQDLATYEVAHGRDPAAYIRDAVKANDDVIRIRPEYYGSYVNNGSNYALVAQYAVQTGKDPAEDSTKAIESLQKAIQINPKSPSTYSNECSVYMTLAVYRGNHGYDPSELLQKACQNCTAALAINPDFLEALITQARVYRSLAEYRLSQSSHAASLAPALKNMEHALHLNPAYVETLVEYSEIYRFLALSRLVAGQSPEREVDLAASFAEKTTKTDASDYRGPLMQARLQILLASWEIQNRRSPDVSLKKAKLKLDQAQKLNPYAAEIYLEVAEYYRRLAESHRGLPEDFDEAFDAVNKAVSLKPDMAEAFAIQAILYLQKARDSKNTAALESGKTALQKAFAINKNLQKIYQPFQAQLNSYRN